MKVILNIEAGSIEELFGLFVARAQAAQAAVDKIIDEAAVAAEPAAIEPAAIEVPATDITPPEKPARGRKTKAATNGAAEAETAPAEAAAPATATRQDMRDQQTTYANMFGMDAALEDTAKLLDMRCPGQGFTKLSQVPDVLVPRVTADFIDMQKRNPFKREMEA